MAKLPKWAQDYMKDLERQAFVAQRTLREYQDQQTQSEFFVEDYDSDQAKMTRKYIQTSKVSIQRGALKVDVYCRLHENSIDIAYYDEGRISREVALVPQGLNSVKIILKQDMR